MEKSSPTKAVDINGKTSDVPAEKTYNEKTSFCRFVNFPVRDYPLLLTFGDFAEIEEC